MEKSGSMNLRNVYKRTFVWLGNGLDMKDERGGAKDDVELSGFGT